MEDRQQVASLHADRPREVGEGDAYSDEVDQIKSQLEKDAERLREFTEEIIALGAEPKDPSEGLIDFPAMIDGRLVYLCWKYDEPEVSHWHELDGGFAGRQPLHDD